MEEGSEFLSLRWSMPAASPPERPSIEQRSRALGQPRGQTCMAVLGVVMVSRGDPGWSPGAISHHFARDHVCITRRSYTERGSVACWGLR